MKKTTFVLLIGLLTGSSVASHGASSLDLAGKWRFQLDRNDQGIAEQWFSKTLSESVQLPGSIQEQGVGEKVTRKTRFALDKPTPFFFDSEYFKKGVDKLVQFKEPTAYYLGAAWFQRDIEIPEAADGQVFMLHLERVLWKSQVWVDGKELGSCVSLYTPHDYNLGALTPGKHTVTVMIDNRQQAPIGQFSHGYSDFTQSIWLGVAGDLTLIAKSPILLSDVQVYGNAKEKRAKVRVQISNHSQKSGKGTLSVVAKQEKKTVEMDVPVTWSKAAGEVEFTLSLGADAKLWDEFDPNLFSLEVALRENKALLDTKTTTFGLRDFKAKGRQFFVNGRKTFLRGTLDCAEFPRTGHPPTTVDEWTRIFSICQDYGLNHVRFHSWCPPKAAFIAADHLGIYLFPELVWTPMMARPEQEWVEKEAVRVFREYGNHPSFCLFAVGNEAYAEINWMRKTLASWKAADPRHLYSGQANGWLRNAEGVQLPTNPPITPEYEFTVAQALGGKKVRAKERMGGGLTNCRFSNFKPSTTYDYTEGIQLCDIPVITHEAVQRFVYPDFKTQIRKMNETSFRAVKLEVGLERLKESGMEHLNDAFVQASGKWQIQLNKEELEGILRTKDYAGFQLLDLHDHIGYSAALVGVLDIFWDSKGIVTPEEYRKFCSPTVPLFRMGKRVFKIGETLSGTVEIANYAREPFKNAVPYWTISHEEGNELLSGKLPKADIALGNGIQLGTIDVDTRKLSGMGKYRIAVGLENTGIENDWEFWVFPSAVPTAAPNNVLVVKSLTGNAKAHLKKGGRILLLADDQSATQSVVSGFPTSFWGSQIPPNTSGILCDLNHPVFADFPTDEHTNWQWWELLSKIMAPNLDSLPKELSPHVRMIDKFERNHRLGLLFEASVGGGKLVVSSLDLETNLDERIVARQLRYSVLKYMTSDHFNPEVTVEVEKIEALFLAPKNPVAKKPTPVAKKEVTKPLGSFKKQDVLLHGVSSEGVPHVGANAIDGNPDTCWHTPWKEGESTGFPHDIIIDLKKTKTVRGIRYLPRQGKVKSGRINDYSIHFSNNSHTWTEVSRGTFQNSGDVQTATFRPGSANYVRLVAESGVKPAPYASIAELEILYEK